MEAGLLTRMQCLEKHFASIWDQETVPSECNKGMVVKILKKESRVICDKYRGIILLTVPSKVFPRILIQGIQDGVEKKLREASWI